MQLHYLLVVVAVNDVKVMSSTVAVICCKLTTQLYEYI